MSLKSERYFVTKIFLNLWNCNVFVFNCFKNSVKFLFTNVLTVTNYCIIRLLKFSRCFNQVSLILDYISFVNVTVLWICKKIVWRLNIFISIINQPFTFTLYIDLIRLDRILRQKYFKIP